MLSSCRYLSSLYYLGEGTGFLLTPFTNFTLLFAPSLSFSPLTKPTVLPSPLVLSARLGLGKFGTPGTGDPFAVAGLLVFRLPGRLFPRLPTLLIAWRALLALVAKNCLQSADCLLPRSVTMMRPP